MKKFIIGIIIILCIILSGQLIYFNFSEKNIENNSSRRGENSITTTQNIAKDFVNEVATNKVEEVIVPEGIVDFSTKYKGELKVMDLEKALYKFVNVDSKTIHDATTGKSINYISQYYDLHSKEVNNMGIYSAKDYQNIARQINLLNKSDKYKSSQITSYEQTTDGYTKSNIILIYENNKSIKLTIYLANSVMTLPNIKISSGE